MTPKAPSTPEDLMWSCDERDRSECRNSHGCHCREITALVRARENLSKLNHARAKLIERHELANKELLR